MIQEWISADIAGTNFRMEIIALATCTGKMLNGLSGLKIENEKNKLRSVNGMTIQQRRDWLCEQYNSAKKWTDKVERMSNYQVLAVYANMVERINLLKMR